MEELHEMKEVSESLILVAVCTGDSKVVKDSLKELAELVKTANATVVDTVIQNLDHANNGTYIGKGKIQELKELIEETGATGIVCDDELSPMQLRNLTDELDTKVMDRTLIILDIFAARAKTKEGKIQVELAQLKYNSTRLAGFGKSMSRLGGGIGTRGPGEKKIDVDRRVIRDRINQLKGEVDELAKRRDLMRIKRKENPTLIASIVGYTNAGKSTLLNRLTDAGVLEEDKLFATLDPTTRNLKLPSGEEILLTDTVGFINKLPHHLIDAFRSTLEEAKFADILIHVVDASNPLCYEQMDAVYETLRQLGVKDKIVITLLNKQDLVPKGQVVKDLKADYVIHTSIKMGSGLEDLTRTLEKILKDQKVYLEKVFPYSEAGTIAKIRKYGQLLSEEYTGEGIFVKAYVPRELGIDGKE